MVEGTPVSANPGRGLPEPVQDAKQLTEETAKKLIAFLERSEPVKRLRASQIASAILGAVGFSLFVFGIERAAEDAPVLSHPAGSIAVGLVLLLATSLLLRKMIGGEQ